MILFPASASAIELEPGLWQDTETGTENGQPVKGEVSTTCLSAEEAKNPIKAILKDAEGKTCEKLEAKENGSVVTVVMRCGDVKDMRIEIDMVLNFQSKRAYSGKTKSLVLFANQKMTTDKTIESKWMSATCKK